MGSVALRLAPVATARALAILSLADVQGPPLEVAAVQCLHGARCVRIRHLHEAEAARATREAIGDQRDFFDRAVFGKQGVYGLIGRSEGQISYIYFGH